MSSDQNTSFTRLVSLACHDLRTPLATVSGFARTIQRSDELEDPVARYLDMIVAASEQMRELLETLSVAVRIEGGGRARRGSARRRLGRDDRGGRRLVAAVARRARVVRTSPRRRTRGHAHR